MSDWHDISVGVKVVILFLIIVVMGGNFLCWGWFLSKLCRQTPTTRVGMSTTVISLSAPPTASPDTTVSLDPQLLASLPTFTYASTDHNKSELECPVCLQEFKNGEEGRFLPVCLHRFHANCVDMWFVSHSTCPLCRSAVEAQIPPV